ncbi:MAG: SDR family NAD(P)-dependent oxidoreductase [Chlamydiota bacterium]
MIPNASKKPLIVITGASSGIGKAVALRFAKEGHPLALVARRMDRLESLQKELQGTARLYKADVRSSDEIFAVFAQIEKEMGPIDLLINNAGAGYGMEPAHETRLTEWQQCVDTNINGLLYCTRAALPAMVKRNRGHIINLGSIAGTYPYPGGNVYGATKAFVHQFSLNLRADLLGTNIRVSCIEPGLTGGTEFATVRFRGDAQKADQVYENADPLAPEDIAEAIYFCYHLPPHVNINTIEMMPVCQASSALSIHRKKS